MVIRLPKEAPYFLLWGVAFVGIAFNSCYLFFNINMTSEGIVRTLVLSPFYFLVLIFLGGAVFAWAIESIKSKNALLTLAALVIVFIVALKGVGSMEIKRLLVMTMPVFFAFYCLGRVNWCRVDRYVNILFFAYYTSAAFSVAQLLLGALHEGRVNGLMQGPNEYAFFLLSFMPLFYLMRMKWHIALTVGLILATQSTTAYASLVLWFLLINFRIRTLVYFLIFSVILVAYFCLFYERGDSHAVDKLFFLYDFLSGLTLSDLKYYSNYAKASELPGLTGGEVSPLNRFVQANSFIFAMSLRQFLFGMDEPKFYESYLFYVISYMGVFGIVFYTWILRFIFNLGLHRTATIMSVILWGVSMVAIPALFMTFASWFIWFNILMMRSDLQRNLKLRL